MLYNKKFRLMGIAATLALAPFSNAQNTQMSAAEIDRLVTDLSNWDRWGADDQLGTLNFITEQKRRSAAALVTRAGEGDTH